MARKTIVWDNIPEWAIYALEYGGDECGALTEEDIAQINAFVLENFPAGYAMDVNWEKHNDFNTNPAFGMACKTYEVAFMVEK